MNMLYSSLLLLLYKIYAKRIRCLCFQFLDGIRNDADLFTRSCTRVQAVKFIEYDSSFSEEEKKQAKTLKVACNLNNAACKLKLKLCNEAEKLCTKVG